MANQFVYGLILGLSLGPACIFSCGAVLGSAVAGEVGRGGRAHLALGKFLAGRLLGYAAVGAAAGALAGAGARLLEPEVVRLAGAATALVLGLALAALGASAFTGHPLPGGCQPACTPRLAAVPVLLGLLAGLSPCPQFVLAVVRAMLGGSWLAGLACFLGLYRAAR